MKQPRRLFPTFNYPLPRFQEQYAQAVKLALVAEKMKDYGVRVDTQRALTHAREGDERAAVFTQMFLELTGLKRAALGEKGEGGTKAVKDWFREAGAPDVVFDKKSGKAKFDAAALTCWSADYSDKEFALPAAALLGLKKSKVNARFARAYYEVATHHDGRIHFDFNTIGTIGHRWSASARFRWRDEQGNQVKYSLNAQNVPKRKNRYDFKGKYGVMVLSASQRDCFIPDPGCEWIKFDYTGAEAYINAYNTQDETMMKWIAEGRDIHTGNAQAMLLELGIPQDILKLSVAEHGKALGELRDLIKPSSYGLIYQSPRKMRADQKITDVYRALWESFKKMLPNLSEVLFTKYIERYWAVHQGARAWQDMMCEQVDRDGYVALPQSGRTIYVAPTGKGKDKALGFPAQSGLGWVINRAIPIVADRCDWKPGGLALLLQVHDELDLQVPTDRRDEVCGFVSEEMSKPVDWGGYVAGIPADPEIGPDWGNVKPRKST